MTTEEKAKAYDEAIIAAKSCLQKGTNPANNPLDYFIDCVCEMFPDSFPELRESEDERIRKEIKQFILDTIGEISIDDKENAWLVWLEKHKEQKQSEMEKEYVRTLHSLISDFLCGKQEIDREYYQKIWDWLDNRHIEQKPDIEICPHSIKSKSYSVQKPATFSEPYNPDDYEVVLEKELDSLITPELKKYKALPSMMDVAKHFYELGLNAKKEGYYDTNHNDRRVLG